MRRLALFPALTWATLACAILAGCTGTPGTTRAAASPPPPSAAGSPRVTGPPGRAPATPGPHDLAIGPMYFPAGLALATHTPAWWGYAPFGRHGRFYKLPLVVRPGATVTVTIGASARGNVLIGVGGDSPGAVSSVTYHACRKPGGFYAQGFAFTRPPFRGCVPLDVTGGGQAQARHVTLSMFAGSCAA